MSMPQSSVDPERFTPAAVRALSRSARIAAARNHLAVEPPHLLQALMEDESHAAELLAEHGVDPNVIDLLLTRLPTTGYAAQYVVDPIDPPEGDDLQMVVIEAVRFARMCGRDREVGSEHLLFGLAVVGSSVAETLGAHGLDEAVANQLAGKPELTFGEPLAVDFEIHFGPTEMYEEADEDLESVVVEPVEVQLGSAVDDDVDDARTTLPLGPPLPFREGDDSPSDAVPEITLPPALEDDTDPSDADAAPPSFAPNEAAESDGAVDVDATSESDPAVDEAAPADSLVPPPPSESLPTPVDIDVLRVIDAAANRAREGLRVAEDHARFLLDDAHLVRRLKEIRHDLANTLDGFDGLSLLRSRDTAGDVGTEVTTESESDRPDARAVATAALKRAEEALRTLEEFAKIVDPVAAGRFEKLRYRLYDVEKSIAVTGASQRVFGDSGLYLLLSREACLHDPEHVVREALRGGVSVVQIREKGMTDRALLRWARSVRTWTREAGAMLIVNDRPDVAVLCDADGVHVGQEEFTVREARRVMGPDRIVGVSTHDVEQAERAVRDGADYIGIGPTFPSRTKSFDRYAGLEFVRAVASSISLPAFAIGGIGEDNVEEVIAAGCRHVAVTAAVCSAGDPAGAAESLVARLAVSPVEA